MSKKRKGRDYEDFRRVKQSRSECTRDERTTVAEQISHLQEDIRRDCERAFNLLQRNDDRTGFYQEDRSRIKYEHHFQASSRWGAFDNHQPRISNQGFEEEVRSRHQQQNSTRYLFQNNDIDERVKLEQNIIENRVEHSVQNHNFDTYQLQEGVRVEHSVQNHNFDTYQLQEGVRRNYGKASSLRRKDERSLSQPNVASNWSRTDYEQRHKKWESFSNSNTSRDSHKAVDQNIRHVYHKQNRRSRSPSYLDDFRGRKLLKQGENKLDNLSLQKIERNSPGEIVHTLHNQLPMFEATLKQEEMANDLIVTILKVLSKSCQSQISKDSLASVMEKTLDSAFLGKHLLGFLGSSGYNELYILQTLSLFKYMLQFIPNSGKRILIPLQTVKGTLLGEEVSEQITNLISRIEKICKGHIQKIPKDTAREQPQSYKTMSVMPTDRDIHSENPSLKALKKHGKYENKDDFLSTHFWLLREDFIRPLRKGIEEYQYRTKIKTSKKNITTVKIYEKVQVIGPKCTFHSIAYTIRFDISRFKRMRWKSSKRLMEGSLLCLSCDNFKTLHFAVVCQRRIHDLQNGYLDVKFDCIKDILSITDKTFTMVESDAYFESYRHILRCIQMIEDIPFQRYLVFTSGNVQAPKYIMDNTATPYKMTIINNETRKVFPLIDTTWPSMESLGLDNCQYEAMKSAVTQELALIQGPPGTGKTYIGLKIIEYFLQNQEKINDILTKDKPILVVCYTNHALDQFLEGINHLPLHPQRKSIIRIGGGCQSEEISQYTIRLRRKGYREYPLQLKRAGGASAQEKRNAFRNLSQAYATVEMFRKGIVHEVVLKDVMGKHYEDMLNYSNPRWFRNSSQYQIIKQYCNKHLHHFSLLEWLLKDDSDIIDMLNWSSKREAKDKGKRSKMGTSSKSNQYEEDEFDGEYFHRQLDLYDEEFEESFQVEAKMQNDSMAFIFPQDRDIPGWMKNWKRMINASNSERMTKEQKDSVKNIWNLPSKERWKLYNYWTDMLRRKQNEFIRNLEEVYTKCCSKTLEILDEKDKTIMEKASVIGMTTTGVAKYQHILQEIQPKIVIIEEAAEILEAHVVTTLNSGCEHLILIGDHKQLRPKPASYDLAEKYNLKISLFERLIMNDLPHVTLEEQHRMRPDISLYMKHIYKEIKDHDIVTNYENIKGIKGNVCFIGHTEKEDQETDLMSKSNDHEAKFLGAMTNYLIYQGYDQSRITVLTPYMGQVLKLRKYLSRHKYPFLRVTAVDNFQGEENDIILLSLVRSNKDNELGFVKEENRICVALSRAKLGLYVIGNFQMLTAVSPLWKRIIDTAHDHGHYKEGLEVFCQNHPNERDVLKTGSEFSEKVPKGGCKKPCNYRLRCGHTCKMKCHPFDMIHQEYRCEERCGKSVCEKHKCQKICHINDGDCGECMELVEKVMPKCKHKEEVFCSADLAKVVCKANCPEILTCGHPCSNKCGEDHTEDCEILVTRKLSCGHEMKARCHMDEDDLFCRDKCLSHLNCGHVCVGTCGNCLQGRIHIPCNSKCERPLVCGHQCKSTCSVICPPCLAKCENKCKHSECPSTCGERCIPCREPCQWSCRHLQCDKECSEKCTRERCNEPCHKLLKCGHHCIGLCGEICPRLCRICNKEKVEDIFFGTEEDEDAKFIELHDCGHVLEVTGLDMWIDNADNDNASEVSVTPKTCPKCKTPIKKTKRYHSTIQKITADVNRVKKKILGDWTEIETMQSNLDDEILKLDDEEIIILRDMKLKMERKFPDLSKYMIICLRNIVNVFDQITKTQSSINECIRPGTDPENENYKALISQLEVLRAWNCKYREFINEQEADELQRELQRLSLFCGCSELDYKRTNSKKTIEKKLNCKFDDLLVNFRKGHPFGDLDLQSGKEVLKEVHKAITGLGVTEQERVEIVKAMGLKQGAWYKCTNGHIYCIGECGGAMEESNCPECKETIGGKRHTLAHGNQHASVMDGSSFAAWSDQANMQNYDFHNFFD